MQLIDLIGFILDTSGKLLVAYTSLMVHHRFTHEHRVDEKVFTAMKKEQFYGFIGIGLIIVGSALELVAKLGK